MLPRGPPPSHTVLGMRPHLSKGCVIKCASLKTSYYDQCLTRAMLLGVKSTLGEKISLSSERNKYGIVLFIFRVWLNLEMVPKVASGYLVPALVQSLC